MHSRKILSFSAFRSLWLGQAISMFGDSCYYIVNAFMVYKVTGNPTLVGVSGALETLPYLLMGPYAGVIADRLDRRRIMVVSDLCSFALLMMLGAVILGFVPPPVEAMLATGLLLSCCRVFFTPAKNAVIPSLVPEEYLLRANALNSTTQNVMPMLGLALSGAMLGALYALSRVWFYFASVAINAFSFLASAVFIRRLPPCVPERSDEKHPVQDFKDGLSYVKHRKVLLVMVAQSLLLNLAIAPFFVVYVTVNDKWFGGKPATLAWFEFSFFVGLVLGSLWVGRMNLKRVGASAMFGIAMVGATVIAMGLTKRFEGWLFWNFLAGIGLPFAQIPNQSYLQATVPDEFRGRVMSVREMAAFGAQPLGLAFGGLIVQKLGLVNSCALMGGGMMLATLVGLSSREYRESRLPESSTGMFGLIEGLPPASTAFEHSESA